MYYQGAAHGGALPSASGDVRTPAGLQPQWPTPRRISRAGGGPPAVHGHPTANTQAITLKNNRYQEPESMSLPGPRKAVEGGTRPARPATLVVIENPSNSSSSNNNSNRKP